ncbi:EspA/EspE family type VII secretion system effector [Mycobacterium shigaense]|uniref:EspA/EspE family type VII secretion system effector n=1 Tax=Mycobacterium shigaense TaxID=722731 RepID=UPI00115B5497|nr:EspA/EspE family type VII secretion system effector [Mycobacterium shigaense]MEA1123851.1 EspA/EspE family type VII secretion system effector [Mycobacterium shigaense]
MPSEIGGLVGSLAGIGRNIAAKDWIATGIGAGAFGMETTKIIVKGIAERRIQAEISQGLEARTNPWAAEVPIIEWGIVAITVFEYSLGLGDATKGIEFDNGRSKLDAPMKDLKAAFPDTRWEGSAADEYANQNQAQLDRVTMMRDQDKAMMDILTAEVAQLTEIRRAIAGIKDGLTGCIFVALLIKAYGSEASCLVFQKVVTAAAITATVSAIGYMEFFSGTETRPKVKKVVEEYDKIIAEMKSYLLTSQTISSALTATGAKSTVSDFRTVTGPSGTPGAPPPPGVPAPPPPVAAPRLDPPTETGQPIGGTPSATRPADHAETISGPTLLTNPVPLQPASTTRRGNGAPAEADEAARPANDPRDATVDEGAEVAGAAPGTGATQRRPLEVASPKTQQAQPISDRETR